MMELDFFLLDLSGVMLQNSIAIITDSRTYVEEKKSINPYKHLGDQLQFNC